MSRDEFARRLGVTQLTVRRWELPEGSKEARRPKGKSLEALELLAKQLRQDAVAEDGPPRMAEDTVPPGERADDEDSPPPASVNWTFADRPFATPSPAFAEDERRVGPLLERLGRESWWPIEDELMSLMG